jgi:hypothetical protein
MARRVRLFGLASLVVVDTQSEIDDLIDHPALDRSFERAGPILNRLLVARIVRQFLRDGRMLLSMRPRDDVERKQGQAQLFHRLDAMAAGKTWAPEAIHAMAHYVATGEQFEHAVSGLTYATAMPFLEPSARAAFDAEQFRRIFRLSRRISQANSPLSPAGFLIRLTGADRRARRKLLVLTGGDDYGLHALMVTIDNGLAILDNLRQRLAESHATGDRPAPKLAWLSARTAPSVVVRQIKEEFTLPHVDARLPAHTLVLFRMRRALRPDMQGGFEFAASHWSACPARSYVVAVFDAVCKMVPPLLVEQSKLLAEETKP